MGDRTNAWSCCFVSPEEVSKAGDQSRSSQPLHNLGEDPSTQPSISLDNYTCTLLLSCLKGLTCINPNGISPSLLLNLSPFFPSSSQVPSPWHFFVFIWCLTLALLSHYFWVIRKRWSTFLKICDLNQITPLQPMQNSREITCLKDPWNGSISKVNPSSRYTSVNVKYIFSLNLLIYSHIYIYMYV